MSLLEHQPEPSEDTPSRKWPLALVGLLVVGGGVAAYLSLAPLTDLAEPAPVTVVADPPPAVRRPAPDPAPAPAPEIVAEAAPAAPVLRVASDVAGASAFVDRR
jgi:hypothetical protein